MKRYGLYLKDANGPYTLKGEQFELVGQVYGKDKEDAIKGVIEKGRNSGKDFELRYIGQTKD